MGPMEIRAERVAFFVLGNFFDWLAGRATLSFPTTYFPRFSGRLRLNLAGLEKRFRSGDVMCEAADLFSWCFLDSGLLTGRWGERASPSCDSFFLFFLLMMMCLVAVWLEV